MMNPILLKIPAYQSFRRFGGPRLRPLNLTLSVTARCNSRCLTCRIHEKQVSELTLDECRAVFRSLGRSPYWLTLSGGEPFLRKDLTDIGLSACEICRPSIINIPTNGLLPGVIRDSVDRLASGAPHARIIVNLSLDEIGERHDEIRGVPGNFGKAMETYSGLRSLRRPNLTVGIHTVISKYNVGRFPEIAEEILRLNPDSYITEIAEERVELGTLGRDIAPSPEDYARAVAYLSERIARNPGGGISGITQAFRLQYYNLVKRIRREGRQVLPCYAGFMSAQIAPDGEVWACCVEAQSLGNLRDFGFDFRKVWKSDRAAEVRERIRRGLCFCPLANASYTNMLASFSTMARVCRQLAATAVGLGPKRRPEGCGRSSD